MSRRSNYIDGNDNFREDNLRFVRNEMEDNFNQFFGGTGEHGTENVFAPPRDSVVVQPSPDADVYLPARRSIELDQRRQYMRKLGLSRNQAHVMAAASLNVSNFDMREIQRKRFQMSMELGEDRQAEVDAYIIREIKSVLEEHKHRSQVRPKTPPPPININWNHNCEQNSPNYEDIPRERRVSNENYGLVRRIDKKNENLHEREFRGRIERSDNYHGDDIYRPHRDNSRDTRQQRDISRERQYRDDMCHDDDFSRDGRFRSNNMNFNRSDGFREQLQSNDNFSGNNRNFERDNNFRENNRNCDEIPDDNFRGNNPNIECDDRFHGQHIHPNYDRELRFAGRQSQDPDVCENNRDFNHHEQTTDFRRNDNYRFENFQEEQNVNFRRHGDDRFDNFHGDERNFEGSNQYGQRSSNFGREENFESRQDFNINSRHEENCMRNLNFDERDFNNRNEQFMNTFDDQRIDDYNFRNRDCVQFPDQDRFSNRNQVDNFGPATPDNFQSTRSQNFNYNDEQIQVDIDNLRNSSDFRNNKFNNSQFYNDQEQRSDSRERDFNDPQNSYCPEYTEHFERGPNMNRQNLDYNTINMERRQFHEDFNEGNQMNWNDNIYQNTHGNSIGRQPQFRGHSPKNFKGPQSQKGPKRPLPPNPGFCVKTFKVNTNEKFFINVCQAPEVPTPKDVTDEELIEILESTTPGSFRVPMSISELRNTKDRSNNSVEVCDIAINPQFFAKIKKSQLFNNFFLQVVVEALSEKYNIQTATHKTIILSNRKHIGTLVTHRVRVDDVQRVEASKNPDQLSEPISNPSKLVQEIDEKQASSIRSNWIKKREPVYKLRARTRDEVVDEIYAELYLPNCVSSQDFSLDIGEDRILVESTKKDFVFDKFVNYRLNQERTQALFDKTSKMLQVRIPVVSN